MQSGRETLATLDTAIRSLRNEIDRVDSELTMATQSLAQNRQQQTQTTRAIAEVRLDGIASGEVRQAIDAAEHQVTAILQQRQDAIDELEQQITAAKEQLAQLEQDRENQNAKVNAAAQAVIDLENTIQTQLDKDLEYQNQLEKARKADEIADRADDKTEQAEADRDEKGTPFEDDKLFMYLWHRGYGTTEYHANPLTRMLDGWVARLCDYNRWRVNYWTLLEIPQRLAQHAERVRNEAEAERDQLKRLEVAAAAKTDLQKLQDTLTATQNVQDQIDDRIAVAEDQHSELLEKRAIYAGGNDQYIGECLSLLTRALDSKEIYQLQQMAATSRTPQDDQLVDQLDDLRDDTDDIQSEIIQYRRQHGAQLKRLKEIEQIRRDFKRRRFDDVRSGFGNGHLISAVLEQFVRGVIGGADVWRTIERHQRHRDVGAWPDFGSGGLGGRRRNRNSPWHRPGGISIKLPSGRGRRSGGFKLPSMGGHSSRSRSRSRISSRGRRKSGFKTGGGF